MGGGWLHFASLSAYGLMGEHRSGAYLLVCEQRSTAYRAISAKIVRNVTVPSGWSHSHWYTKAQ